MLFPLLVASVQSATINVPEDHATITAAVAAAGANDTISIGNGFYGATESWPIEIPVDSLAIVGRSGDPTGVLLDTEGGNDSMFQLDERVDISFRNIQFQDSDALGGTVIYASGTQKLLLENCIVKDCTGAFAAPVYFLNTSGAIQGCTFEGNVGAFFGGGFAYVNLDSEIEEVSISDSHFIGNEVLGFGGSIFAGGTDAFATKNVEPKGGGSPTFFLDNCTFTESMAGQTGGAVGIAGHPDVNLGALIQSCTFENCSATGGGAISIIRNSGNLDVDILDTGFLRNGADSTGGGAILVTDYETPLKGAVSYNLRLEVNRCRFVINQTNGNGGSIRIEPSVNHLTEYGLINSSFERGSARNGATIMIGPDPFTSSLKNDEKGGVETTFLSGVIGDSTFTFNTAFAGTTGFGGAIYLSQTDTTVRNNSFVENQGRIGGAIALYRDYSIVRENFIGDPREGLLGVGNVASNSGGGIAIFLEAEVLKGVSDFLRPRVYNNLFYDNRQETRVVAELGGGALVLLADDPTLVRAMIGGNVFINNQADSGNGHAFYIFGEPPEDVLFIHNTLINNQPPLLKGATFNSGSMIYLGNSAEPTFSNNIFYYPMEGGIPSDVTGVFEAGDTAPKFQRNVFFGLDTLYVDNLTNSIGLNGLNLQPQNAENFSVDPQFEAPGDLSFGAFNPHLSQSSPLIDEATLVFAMPEILAQVLPTDIDALYDPPGNSRFIGDLPDVGADEVLPLPTETPTPTNTDTPTETLTFTPTSSPTATETPVEATLTATTTFTPTATVTADGTATPTPSATPTVDESASPTATQTPIDCDIVPGDVNPRCDAFDLLALLEDRAGVVNFDTDFNDDGNEDSTDLFLFSNVWYQTPTP